MIYVRYTSMYFVYNHYMYAYDKRSTIDYMIFIYVYIRYKKKGLKATAWLLRLLLTSQL